MGKSHPHTNILKLVVAPAQPCADSMMGRASSCAKSTDTIAAHFVTEPTRVIESVLIDLAAQLSWKVE